MLKQRATSATLWSGADVFLRQGTQFVISIFLARILTPSDFGTIALLYLFVGLATTFVDSGFSATLIKKQDTTHVDESTVFWINLFIGLVAGLGLWLLAPTIARLFDTPILLQLTGVMALNIVISAAGSIHGTLLTKRLDFRTQMKVGFISTGVSGVIGILMARYGFGVWALAANTFVASLLTTALLWHYSAWRPVFVLSYKSLKELFGFGGFLFAAGLLDVTYQRLYTLLIGKYYGTEQLGFYNRADGTKQLPAGVLNAIVARVAFPVFTASVASGDQRQLVRGVRFAIRGIMLINVPVMLGLAAISDPLILTLFGRKWIPAGQILQVLCLAGLFWPLHMVNLYALAAQGHSNLYFRIELIKKIIGVAFLLCGFVFGVIGVAWSQVAFGLVSFAIDTVYTQKFLSYGFFDQIKDVTPIILVSVPVALSAAYVQYYLHIAAPLEVLAAVSVGILVFAAQVALVKIPAVDDMVRFAREAIVQVRA